MLEIELEQLKRTVNKLSQQLSETQLELEGLKNPQTTLKSMGCGVAIEDKNDGSKNLLVHLHETFPTMEGELSPLHTNAEYKGTDIHGNEYSHTLQSNTSIKCVWLETPNRLTSPNIRKGQQVEVFQSGDGDKFYWSEIGRQKDMKRAERILLGVNASKTPTTEEDAVTPHNHYSLDIDAKSGHITALTSKQNGEHCKYVIQLNTKDGYLVIQDDLGNHISMNSKTSTHMLQTKEGAYVSIVKKDVKMKGGEFRAEFDKIILDGETEITKKATTNEINNTGKISTTISVDTPNINNTDIGSYLNN